MTTEELTKLLNKCRYLAKTSGKKEKVSVNGTIKFLPVSIFKDGAVEIRTDTYGHSTEVLLRDEPVLASSDSGHIFKATKDVIELTAILEKITEESKVERQPGT